MNNPDYRVSHISKGDRYDEELARDPWERFMARRESAILDRIIRRRFPAGIQCHLDFACGTGRAFDTTREWACRLVGVDISASMLAEARLKVPEAEYVLADVTRDATPLPKADLITAFRFFGNAEPELRSEVLSSLRRAILPNGMLVIDNHRNPKTIRHLLSKAVFKSQLTSTPFARWDLDHSSLKLLLLQHGFKPLAVHGIGWWIYRSKIAQSDTFNSSTADKLELLGDIPILATLSPTAIIVATPAGN